MSLDAKSLLDEMLTADSSNSVPAPSPVQQPAWTADNWKENPGLSTNSRNRMDAALAKHNLSEDLFNARTPQMSILHESPDHRRVITLKAHGLPNKEIAALTGYKPSYITTILRQPWARSIFAQLCAAQGAEAHSQFLQQQVMPSLVLLSEVRDNEEAKPSDRLAAARDLLDRAQGKPTIRVQTQQLPPVQAGESAKQELEALRRRQEELAAAQERLLGFRPNRVPETTLLS